MTNWYDEAIRKMDFPGCVQLRHQGSEAGTWNGDFGVLLNHFSGVGLSNRSFLLDLRDKYDQKHGLKNSMFAHLVETILL